MQESKNQEFFFMTNIERFKLGMIEFFAVSILSFLISNYLEKTFTNITPHLLNIMLIIYAFLIPLFFKGRTLFMVITGQSFVKENGDECTNKDFLLRSIIKYPLLFIGVDAVHAIVKPKERSIFDRKLGILVQQKKLFSSLGE